GPECGHLGMGRVRLRCSECRKSFLASATTGSRQKVCSAPCRVLRDRKLARLRRLREVAEYRADEAARQRACRARARSREPCHAPPSSANQLKFQKELEVFVDRALGRSRATLLRDLAGIVPYSPLILADTG